MGTNGKGTVGETPFPDGPCEDCATAPFDIKSKALEMSVSYCQTEALLEITKMNKGETSFGVPSPNAILKRAKQFEAYLNESDDESK